MILNLNLESSFLQFETQDYYIVLIHLFRKYLHTMGIFHRKIS